MDLSPSPPVQNGHAPPSPPSALDGPDDEVERFAVDPTLRARSPPGLERSERSVELELDLSRTVYLDMVHPRPFVNSDFVRPSTDPSHAYPESNREAVVSALRKLQDKVRSLELERSAAEDNLKTLASETNKYRDNLAKELDRERDSRNASPNVSQQTHKLESQLSSAEMRCQLLEKQLEHMRRMVTSAERDRKDAVVRTAVVEQERNSSLPSDLRNKLERISQLEREHLRMTATQSVTESKMRELEDQLREERTMRLMMRDLPPQPEQPPPPPPSATTVEPAGRFIQQDSAPASSRHKKKECKKKKKKVVASKKNNHHHHHHQNNHHHGHSDGMKHYRLNLADIPFVAGKSTGPSHSVGANVQRVLSLMKSHNTALCSSQYGDTDSSSSSSSPSPSPSASASATNLDSDLADLLLQLQDEFGRLSCEHQELVRQLSVAQSYQQRDELERELESLVERMDSKSKQISKIRQHQAKLDDMKKKLKKPTNGRKPVELPVRPHSAADYATETRSCDRQERGRQPKRKGFISRPRPSSAHQVSLNVLKDMKKLQTTLRKDDLKWE